MNSKLGTQLGGSPVRPRIPSIAASSLRSLYDTASARTIEQAYTDALNARAQFRLAYVPGDFPLIASSMAFNQTDMQRLYGWGEQLGRSGEHWIDRPPGMPPRAR